MDKDTVIAYLLMIGATHSDGDFWDSFYLRANPHLIGGNVLHVRVMKNLKFLNSPYSVNKRPLHRAEDVIECVNKYMESANEQE